MVHDVPVDAVKDRVPEASDVAVASAVQEAEAGDARMLNDVFGLFEDEKEIQGEKKAMRSIKRQKDELG